jgi:hypothetical protein
MGRPGQPDEVAPASVCLAADSDPSHLPEHLESGLSGICPFSRDSHCTTIAL